MLVISLVLLDFLFYRYTSGMKSNFVCNQAKADNYIHSKL